MPNQPVTKTVKRGLLSVRYASILLVALLASCSAADEIAQPEGIWHESELLGEFVDQWAVCGHFYAVTEDNQWLLSIDVASKPGMYDERELVSLLNFSEFSDRRYAITLFRTNDIAIENREPIRLQAIGGDGEIRITNNDPSWESTMELDFRNLKFLYDGSDIHIDRVYFSKFYKPNWCPG